MRAISAVSFLRREERKPKKEEAKDSGFDACTNFAKCFMQIEWENNKIGTISYRAFDTRNDNVTVSEFIRDRFGCIGYVICVLVRNRKTKFYLYTHVTNCLRLKFELLRYRSNLSGELVVFCFFF